MYEFLKDIIFIFLPEKYKNNKPLKIFVLCFLFLVVLAAGYTITNYETVKCLTSTSSFTQKKNTFNVLILSFKRVEDDHNLDIKLEDAIKDGLNKMNTDEKSNIQIIYDCKSTYSNEDTSRILEIAKLKNADLVIYGNYYESSKRTDIEYILYSKYNFIESESGKLENRSLNSMADIKQGYLLYDINYIIYWVFALKSYVNGDLYKSIVNLKKINSDNQGKFMKLNMFLAKLYSLTKQYYESIRIYNNLEMANIKQANLYLNRGYCYKLIGDTTKSINDYYTAFQLDSTNIFVNYNLSLKNLLNRNIDSSFIYINRSIRYKSNDISSYNMRGILDLEIGDTISAWSDFNLAINISPNDYSNINTYKNVGNILVRRNNFDQALIKFLKAEAIGDNNYMLYFNIGFCYVKLQKFQEAASYFKKSETINPKFGLAVYFRSSSLSLFDLDSAKIEYNNFLNMELNDYQSLNFRAEFNIKINRYKQAIVDFEKIITMFPEFKDEISPRISFCQKYVKNQNDKSFKYQFDLPIDYLRF